MMQHSWFLLFVFVMMSCSTAESRLGDLARCPSADENCADPLAENQRILANFAEVMNSDAQKGAGFEQASLFVANQKQSIRRASEASSPKAQQIVSFYDATLPISESNLRLPKRRPGGTGVLGRPTRVYVDSVGNPAYIAFDKQEVSLLEFRATTDSGFFRVIPKQGPTRHPMGFSTPIGLTKGFGLPLSSYSIEELRRRLGKEGDQVSIEFSSGVKVVGVLEGYTSNGFGDGDKPTVISFKHGTCSVTFGVHQLFKPEWGSYDMLLARRVTDSDSSISLANP